MRLFTAIIFNEEIKDNLENAMEKLKDLSVQGSYTNRDNLHLTLNFIGETKRLALVREAMQKAVDKTGSGSFTLSIGGCGRFKRREGDILWAGVDKEDTLWRLQKELVVQLKEAGFDVDDLEYKPHLTLVRRARVNTGPDSRLPVIDIPPMSMEVTKISLMESSRIEGRLAYTEIYRVDLTD